MGLVSYDIGGQDHRGCTCARVDVAGEFTIRGVGDSLVGAFSNAVRVAQAAVNDPVIAAVMPPQITIALKTAQAIATAVANGTEDKLEPKLKTAGARRLLRRLARAHRRDHR